MKLYKDVINLILDFIPEYKLRDWVDEKKVNRSLLAVMTEFKKGINKAGWIEFSTDVSVIEKNLEEGGDKVNWYWLSENPAAISLLEKNLQEGGDKVNWTSLSRNPAAIPILEKNLEEGGGKVNWDSLSRNPAAIPILEKNLDKVDWRCLSANPAAISILEKNRDKICWNTLSSNPAIFIPYRDPKLFKILMEIEIR